MGILEILLLVLFVLIAFLLVGMVLLQDDQGDGLAGMFGGGSTSTFGSRAGNVLTRTTSILGALFIVVALGLAVLFRTPDSGDVAAAARQQGAKNAEWWNAQPAPAPLEAPAAVPTSPAVPAAPATVPAPATTPKK